MFALIDCNSFYASCERVFRPDWHNKPLVVLSNNDGCAIAMSAEAKAMGIPMGAPFHEIKKLCNQHNIIVRSSNFALYADMSARVMAVIREMGLPCEIYSIDEAFLQCKTINFNDISNMMRQLRARILQYTGIPVSVGVGATKTLAKLANRLAKRGAGGVYILDNDNMEYALKNTKIGDIWGVGRAYMPLLMAHNIHNAHQFINARPEWVKRKMTIHGMRIWYELRAVGCYNVETQPPAKQNSLISRSFQPEIAQYLPLHATILRFCSDLAANLRRDNQLCGAISVFMATNRFRDGYCQLHGSYQLPQLSNNTLDLANAVRAILPKIYRHGLSYKRGGVMAHDLRAVAGSQLPLWETNTTRTNELCQIMDKVNARYGRNTLHFGAQPRAINGGFTPHQHNLSPRYTTNWNDLLMVA